MAICRATTAPRASGSRTSCRSGISGRARPSATRSPRSWCIVGLISLWLGLAAAAQEVAPAVVDPLFGLEVPQDGPGFERVDPALLRRCTIGPPGSEQQSWVFASTQTSSGTFLALGGLSRMV